MVETDSRSIVFNTAIPVFQRNAHYVGNIKSMKWIEKRGVGKLSPMRLMPEVIFSGSDKPVVNPTFCMLVQQRFSEGYPYGNLLRDEHRALDPRRQQLFKKDPLQAHIVLDGQTRLFNEPLAENVRFIDQLQQLESEYYAHISSKDQTVDETVKVDLNKELKQQKVKDLHDNNTRRQYLDRVRKPLPVVHLNQKRNPNYEENNDEEKSVEVEGDTMLKFKSYGIFGTIRAQRGENELYDPDHILQDSNLCNDIRLNVTNIQNHTVPFSERSFDNKDILAVKFQIQNFAAGQYAGIRLRLVGWIKVASGRRAPPQANLVVSNEEAEELAKLLPSTAPPKLAQEEDDETDDDLPNAKRLRTEIAV